MAEDLIISTAHKKQERYGVLIPQVQSLVEDEPDLIANLANIAAALKQTFNFLWVGFYRVDNQELVLGPFQGPVACTRIPFGKGVCGTAWRDQKTIIVPDVDEFPGHIACSSASRSEIVVPIALEGVVKWILDVDSETTHYFDDDDRAGLEEIANIIESHL